MAENAEVKKPGVRKVKIRLFKDNDKYKAPVFVSVNGESYLIQRGVEVEVPVYVAEVIDNSAHQDAAALAYMEILQKDAEADALN